MTEAKPNEGMSQDAQLLVGCASVIVLVVFLFFLNRRYNPPLSPERVAAAARAEEIKRQQGAAEERIRSSVKLDYTWGKGGFGSVMLATFTFINPSDRPVKDITVVCTLSAPSGTQLGTVVKTIYQTVPAKGKLSVGEQNLGFIDPQAEHAGCRIANVVIQ